MPEKPVPTQANFVYDVLSSMEAEVEGNPEEILFSTCSHFNLTHVLSITMDSTGIDMTAWPEKPRSG